MEGQITALPEIDYLNADTTIPSEFKLPDVFAEEVLSQMDPGSKIDTIFLATEKGDMQFMKGPFSHEQAKSKVDEYRELTQSCIVEIEFDFIH